MLSLPVTRKVGLWLGFLKLLNIWEVAQEELRHRSFQGCPLAMSTYLLQVLNVLPGMGLQSVFDPQFWSAVLCQPIPEAEGAAITNIDESLALLSAWSAGRTSREAERGRC